MAGAVAGSVQHIFCRRLFLTFLHPFQSFSSSSLPHPPFSGLFCPLCSGTLSDAALGEVITHPSARGVDFNQNLAL